MIEPRFETPILFLVFNRPELTQVVFAMIRKIRPARLYVAADGPRKDAPEDLGKCDVVRHIATRVDWDCEVRTLFRDENVGCGKAVSGAIDWFFDHEAEGVIIEDDCLPTESFFAYCQELLERYRDDLRVMHISGYNPLPDKSAPTESYYFSRYPGVWGWATWRRAWQNYDFAMKSLPEFCADQQHDYGYNLWHEKAARIKVFKETYEARIDTWDYQWAFALRINGGLCIRPMVSMVSNLGLGAEATHTKHAPGFPGNNDVSEIPFPLVHPERILPNKHKDVELFQKVINRKNLWHLVKNLLLGRTKSFRGDK